MQRSRNTINWSVRTKLNMSLAIVCGFLFALIWLLFYLPETISSLSHSLLNYTRPLDAKLASSPLGKARLSRGTKLTSGLSIAPFQLRDHNNQVFNNQALKGKWHLISYGYTSCPDICPNTLLLLSQLEDKLRTGNKASGLHFLFYTIDPVRDSVEKLALYVAYFSENLTGIRAEEKDRAKVFEQELGIKAVVNINSDNGDYQVSHGGALYLINPDGKLQAVFQPLKDPFGNLAFDIDILYRDYLWIRNNLD
ncbi:SCO family protein [Thalassomonas haliotis]|uniref:SCO family protein n=1 Tax=Thalassomonas haliotis TaxID=485448 RepID=A0ABY7VC65_9GAMM|nr:SCO family protein [Thalassomonas haliotis]WDE11255.1 SCO family protein [Thalassomonas haliotis]